MRLHGIRRLLATASAAAVIASAVPAGALAAPAPSPNFGPPGRFTSIWVRHRQLPAPSGPAHRWSQRLRPTGLLRCGQLHRQHQDPSGWQHLRQQAGRGPERLRQTQGVLSHGRRLAEGHHQRQWLVCFDLFEGGGQYPDWWATLLGAYVEGAVSSNCTAYGWGAKPPKRTASITISGGKITTGATTREIKKKENPCERGTNFCTTAVWLKASEFTNGSSQDVTIRTKVDYGDQAKDSGKSFVVHANRKGYDYPSYYTFPRGYLPLPSLPWAGHADRDSHFDEKLAKYYDAHGWYYGKGWEAHHILQLDHCSGYYRCNDPGGNGWFLPESQHDVVSAWWANVEEVS